MGNDFLTVGGQVLTLFLLIAVGALCAKTRLLDDKAVKAMANLVLYIATPAVIIKSCIRPFNQALLWDFLIVAAVAAVNHLVLILVAKLVFRDPDERRRRVLKCCTVFSNAGYMAIPLQQAILGDDGVFYCAAYVIVFNVFLWTYGLMEMSGQRRLSPKQILLNPGVIGVAVGLVLFLLPIPVPALLQDAIGHMAVLNTPLPMVIIGYYLIKTNLLTALKDKAGWLCMILRLLGMPLLALAGLLLCGVGGNVLTACMICISTPAATACTMFSTRYDLDTGLSVNLVSVSTLLSVLTIPTMVAIANYLGSIL
ncbi:MAG: AEC family transporter [Ruminococcaceae bacterium]|nr:AEC family transporter [Oscillospiraceae bacterium]